MLVYSSKPINYINNKVQIPLREDEILDENAYEDAWLPYGDNPETDIYRLIQQNRLSKT